MEPEDLEMIINALKFVSGASYRVDVTHINDPGSFYVRPASVSDFVDLLEVPGKPVTHREVEIRKRVIYKSETFKKFVRGTIQDIHFDDEKTTCVISAIDYGGLDKNIPLKDISLPQTHSHIDCPPLATHCELYFCHPRRGDTFDKEATETMKFFVGSHPAKMTVQAKSNEKLMVELNTVECPDDLSSMLGYMNCTQLMPKEKSDVSRFHCAIALPLLQCEPKELKVGEKIYVRVQNGDSISNFYVAEINDHKEYIRYARSFSEYCLNRPIQDVTMAMDGRCCGIRYGKSIGDYERGIIKSVNKNDNTCLAKLVDLGKEVHVNCEFVKEVSSEFFVKQPAIAINCSSTEDQMWKNGLPKFLYPGYEFFIEVVKKGVGDTPHTVKLYRSTEM